MEPNKLEKEIREKLEKREIRPGEMAWDRLDAMLTVAEKKKPKNRAWLYVAASFLGLLLAVTFFLKQEAEAENIIINENENTIVNASKNTVDDNTTNSNSATEDEVVLPVVKAGHVKVQKPTVNNIVVVKSHAKKEPENSTLKETTTIIAQIIQKQETEMLAVNQKGAANISPGQEAEILLITKMNSTALNIKTGPVKINPNKLLNEVEGELNDNFRSKAWQSVTKNYNVVRATVVNRNIE